jgi:hypothetical protein
MLFNVKILEEAIEDWFSELEGSITKVYISFSGNGFSHCWGFDRDILY